MNNGTEQMKSLRPELNQQCAGQAIGAPLQAPNITGLSNMANCLDTLAMNVDILEKSMYTLMELLLISFPEEVQKSDDMPALNASNRIDEFSRNIMENSENILAIRNRIADITKCIT